MIPKTALCVGFQSTRPRGARLPAITGFAARYCFNPRAREGRDVPAWGIVHSGGVSIHAPARGATRHHQRLQPGHVFQSTRPRGARLPVRSLLRLQIGFNPRAREGRDGFERLRTEFVPRFNPRAREGRDPPINALRFELPRFNPRAREGRDHGPAPSRSSAICFNPRAREGRDHPSITPVISGV